MRTFVQYLFALCLLVGACFGASVRAQTPLFPPDPGELYIPPVVTIMGQEVEITDPEDTTVLIEEIDIYDDGTLVYNTSENTLTLSNLMLEVGDSLSAAVSYTGSEPLVIVLCDSSNIMADTVIASTSDIIITGEGILVAEAVVPIVGHPTAHITFDSVRMHVRSLPSPAAVRRRIKGAKYLDEDGGPALSGFASADFPKTNITPPEADYGEIESNAPGEPTTYINALYVPLPDGTYEVLTEFELTPVADKFEALPQTQVTRTLDTTQPMYNILGIQVRSDYKGIVIQNGQTFFMQ